MHLTRNLKGLLKKPPMVTIKSNGSNWQAAGSKCVMYMVQFPQASPGFHSIVRASRLPIVLFAMRPISIHRPG